MNHDLTYIQNLSSALQATLSSFQSPEFLNTADNLLSAVQGLSGYPQLSDIDNLINQLSSIPLHPYQNLLWRHFEPDHEFKSIDDVPEPEEIPVNECIKFFDQKEKEISRTIFHNLTCTPEQQLHSPFEFLSGEQILCHIDKQKKYLEFFEMVRQIPIDSITTENYTVLAKKLIAEYVKVV